SHGRCEAHYGTGSGDDKTYSFDVYTTTVDFGNGLVTQPTYVGVATDSNAFDQDYHGILGVGPHSASPLMSSVTSALPGSLSHGMLLDERGRSLTFGPNPLPTRVHLDGSPHVSAEISLNGGATHKVTATIDSGGGYGAISSTLVPTDGLVPGTVLSVYADDGKTLLYSYTLTEDNIPKESKNSAYFNTGVQAFMSGPIYVDFTKTDEEGEVVGATDFDYSWWGWKAPAIRLPWI
ncbi:MAG: hypothetical protein SW019_23240, partial [Actinomycetota bacterium]|nr:hypothetical protein [Actinomycetota bacterium]